jgi:glycogen phosphorylase
MTALALRTAGVGQRVSQLHGEVTREMWGSRSGPAWPTSSGPSGHHQRRACARRGCRPRSRRLLDATSAPTGASSTTTRRSGRPHPGDPRRGALGRPGRRCGSTSSPSSASAPARRWTRSASAPPASSPAGTLLDPERADDRVRAAVHRLQAPGADLPRPGAARAHPQRLPPARADRVRRQGAPGRRERQAPPAAGLPRAVDPLFGGRIAFVDDYDLHVAHFLVQGCDVWLNNPRKPLEASGTSGMKAAINGVPHLSIGDGWWAEGFTGDNGWLIEGRPIRTTTTRRTPRTPRRSTACSKSRSSRPSTSATPTGVPRRWLRS